MSKIKSKQNNRKQKVTFSIYSPDAEEVTLIGDFNNWNPKKHPMKKDGNGLWAKSVIIPPGQYEYKYLIDGEWKEDPQNILTVPNSYGTRNSVLNLGNRSSWERVKP